MKFRLFPSLLTSTTRILFLIVAVTASLMVVGGTANAQTGPTDGMTPSGLSHGLNVTAATYLCPVHPEK
jgi:predicted choloylglycine hydrolase